MRDLIFFLLILAALWTLLFAIHVEDGFNPLNEVGAFYFINLQHRDDRRRHIEQVLTDVLQNSAQSVATSRVVRIEGVLDNHAGYTGCTKAHLSAVRKALEDGHEYVAIMEDDFMLAVGVREFTRRLGAAWKRLNGSFDVLYLAMTPSRLDPIMSGFHRVRVALAMPAFIVHRSYLPVLAEMYEEALRQRVPHDMITQQRQAEDYWYGFFPPIGRQKPGHSDVTGTFTDYGYLELEGAQMS